MSVAVRSCFKQFILEQMQDEDGQQLKGGGDAAQEEEYVL
jgi:hypothetical protein